MARILSVKPKSRVFCGTVEYEVLQPASLTSVQVRNVINGEVRILLIDELSSHSADEMPLPSIPFDSLSQKKQKEALERFSKIEPAILRRLSREEIEALADKNGVHFTTIYRMMTRFLETRDLASLPLKFENRGGKGKSRIEPAVDNMILKHFEEIVAAKQVDITKLTVKSLAKEIKGKSLALGLKSPATNTVADRLEKFIIDKRLDKKRKRKGGNSRTMAGGMFPDANWPLDIVQIDHTPLDIIIVDSELREPIGRPYLSIAIDVFSRMVVGFSISLDAPSIFSVGRLIAHCILPKREFLGQVGVEADWNIFGMMGTILMDNAGEFRSDDFIPFEEEYHVGIRWRPVATPEYGGHIERLAKTLNDYVHGEPGSTMGNIFKREGYDSEGKACYTLDEIEKWLTILITKLYHVDEHSSLKNSRGEKLSPKDMYEIGILGDESTPGIGNPDIVEDQERLKLFLLPSFERSVQREGIELDVKYFHDILRTLYGQKGEDGKTLKYLIKRDPRRISPIYIYDPELNDFFAIPYRDLTKPPISLWELNAAKKRCKEKGISQPTEQQIFAAYGELREVRDESVAKTKTARRGKEAAKRRSKDTPVYPKESSSGVELLDTDSDNTDDVASFYEDADLLAGVIVKKTSRER